MRGLKTTRIAWMNPLYARRRRDVTTPVRRSPEEIEAERERLAEETRQWLERNSRGFNKLKDREARTAVEGDTDLNHDNVEAAE